MLKNLRWIVPIIMASGIAGPAAADVITDWNEKAVAFVTTHKMLPPPAERTVAAMHVAMFDAVNSIERRYRPYAVQPALYVPTPITASSMWPNVTPFAMRSPSQFRPDAPIPLASAQWAADYNEIKALGGKTSTARSARQTEDARFWLITGPQSYYPIARRLVTAKKMNLIESARFMALTAVATSDAYVAVFDAKYHYQFWRPITAIRNGDMDDNAATERDAAWQPIDNTPMHPEYPCAHCITSAAVAAVAETLLGSADVPELTMTSSSAPGVTHRWTNLRAYTDEVSVARIYAGFHYRFSTKVGQDMGRKIAAFVVQNVMQPVSVAEVR